MPEHWLLAPLWADLHSPSAAITRRALTDLNRERDRSRKNIVSRVQAERRVAACQEELAAAQAAAQASTTRFQGLVGELESALLTTRAQVVVQEDRCSALERDKENLGATVEGLRQRVAGLEAALQEAMARVDDTQAALAKETGLRVALERELAATEDAHVLKYEQLIAQVRVCMCV